MNRRQLLQGLIGLAVVTATPKLMSDGLEMIARAEAEEKAPISEQEFNRLMGYNTVDDILREYNISSVDDSSYKRKVYDSDKHVMVLFYNNRAEGSKGLAILTGLFTQKFGINFVVYGYKLSEGSTTPEDLTVKMFREHSIKKTPAILFYKKTELPNVNERVISGITTHTNLDKMYKLVVKYINESII